MWSRLCGAWSVEVEIPGGLRHGFTIRLAQRLLETLRQVVIAGALGFE